MPVVDWGIDSSVVDDWDRDSQFKPYTGTTPPNGVYLWNVKVLKFSAGTREKHPQLRLGLELAPRSADEERFAGYFAMKFMSISENNAWVYTPFLDAIGVSGDDFTLKTRTDEEGNVRKIGRWQMNGKTKVLAQLQDGTDQNNNPRKEIGWIGADDNSGEYTDPEEEEYDDEEEEEAPRRRPAKKAASRRSTSRTSRRSNSIDDDDF